MLFSEVYNIDFFFFLLVVWMATKKYFRIIVFLNSAPPQKGSLCSIGLYSNSFGIPLPSILMEYNWWTVLLRFCLSLCWLIQLEMIWGHLHVSGPRIHVKWITLEARQQQTSIAVEIVLPFEDITFGLYFSYTC